MREPGSSPLAASLGVVLLGAALALAPSDALPQGSERFWLALPVAAGALGIAWATDRREAARQIAMGGCATLAAGGCAVAVVGASLCALSFPSVPGAWHRVPPSEVAIGAWYLLGLILVAAIPWQLARWLVARLAALRADPSAGDPPLIVQVAPLPLALPLIAPLLLGSMLVHRFKLPLLVPPPAGAEQVAVVTADGLTIRGWFLPAERPSPRTVLLGHGLGANRSVFLPFFAVAEALDANVLAIDLRGHGTSDGHTVGFGCREKLDVLAAIDWLRTARPEAAQRVIGVGISLSTAAMVLAAAEVEPPLDGLVVDSGFTAPLDLAGSVISPVPEALRPLLVVPGLPVVSAEVGCWLPDIRPIDAIDRVRAPVLLVHAEGDPLIPVEHGRRLYQRALPPKALLVSPTPDHAMSLLQRPEPYLDEVRRLFAR